MKDIPLKRKSLEKASAWRTPFDVPAEIRNTDLANLDLLPRFGHFDMVKVGQFIVGTKWTTSFKNSTEKSHELVNDADFGNNTAGYLLLFTDQQNSEVPSYIGVLETLTRQAYKKLMAMEYGNFDTPEVTFTKMIPLNATNTSLVVREGELYGMIIDSIGYFSINGLAVKKPGKEEKKKSWYYTDTDGKEGTYVKKAGFKNFDDKFENFNARQYGAGKRKPASRRGVTKKSTKKRTTKRVTKKAAKKTAERLALGAPRRYC